MYAIINNYKGILRRKKIASLFVQGSVVNIKIKLLDMSLRMNEYKTSGDFWI